MYKKILVAALIALLFSGNIYFYNKTEKLDYAIRIGTHASRGEINFNKPLSNREDSNMVIFSLIDGISIEKPTVCEKLPDSTIWIDDWTLGATYLIVNLWVDNDTVIFETGVNSTEPEYKKVDGARGVELKKLLAKYNLKNTN